MRTIIRTFAAAVSRAPWLVIAGAIVASLVFGALASTVETGGGPEGFSPESEEILASERISDLFGESATQTVLQVVVRSSDGDVLNADGLAAAGAIREAIAGSEAAEFVSDDPFQPGVVSYMLPVQQAIAQQELDPSALDDDAIKNLYAQALANGGEELGIVAQLVPEGSDTTPEIGLALVFVDASADFETQIEREKTIADAIDAAEVGGDIELRPFSFNLLFGDDTADPSAEIGRLFGIAFAIIIGVLMFVYWLKPGRQTRRRMALRRTVADTSVTMLTIVLAIIWMNGIGALLQRIDVLGPFTEIAQIVPILLIGLGVDYGIHLTSRYRDEVGHGATVRKGMSTAIGTVGVALTLATVTTAIGFLTNVVNPIPALRDFGVLAAIGIVVSFLLMLTFVPALRSVLDRRAEAGDRLPRDGMGATSQRLLPTLAGKTAILAEKAPVPTLVVMALLGGLGYLGLSNLSTEFSFTDFLPEDAPVVETLDIIEQEFAGGFGETTQVLVEGEDLATPEAFNAIADGTASLATTPDVLSVAGPTGVGPSVNSPVAIVQRLAAPGPDGAPLVPGFVDQVVADGYDPASGTVAADADVPAILAAAREIDPSGLDAVVHLDDDGTVDAMLMEIGTQAGENHALDLRDNLVADLAPISTAGASVTPTSQNIISGAIVQSLSSSQVTSLMITLVVATLVLMLSFWIENRRPFLGVLTMIPVALVVLWTFGLMYVSGIPFGPVTATLTGLAVGIGVPYTIHMARRFEEDRTNYDDVIDAIRATTRNTGGALAGSAFTTAAGFGVLVTSSLVPFQQMGQVTAYAIVLSLLGALLVLPSLLVLWERWHQRRGDKVVEQETVSVA